MVLVPRPFSTMSTPASAKIVNTLGVATELLLLHSFGPPGIVLPFAGAVFLSCVFGIVLFHCQHTFNPGYVVPAGVAPLAQPCGARTNSARAHAASVPHREAVPVPRPCCLGRARPVQQLLQTLLWCCGAGRWRRAGARRTRA